MARVQIVNEADMQVTLSIAAGASTILGAAAGTVHRGVTSSRSQIIAPSVYHGDHRRRVLSLTFDDGPSESTAALLDLLGEHCIPATFFQCGANVQRLPKIARRVHKEGHEIGNHTFTHARLCPRIGFQMNLRSPSNIHEELSLTQQVIALETGVTPKLFRPPYGLRWFGLRSAQRRLGLTSVLWTVIARDWELPSAAIAELVVRGATPGGIICLHDGRDVRVSPDISEMLTALKRIIPVLKRDGFAFETAGRSIFPDNVKNK